MSASRVLRELVFGLVISILGTALASEVMATPVYTGGFRFPATKVQIRFDVDASGLTTVSSFDPSYGESKVIYTGKLAEIGVNGNSTQARSIRAVDHKAPTFTYAITAEGDLLLISDRGLVISHPNLPRELLFARIRAIDGNAGDYSVLSLSSKDQGPATYLFDHKGKRLIKAGARSITDKEIEEIAIDYEENLAHFPCFNREIDLERLEFEELFDPRPAQAVLNREGQPIRPLEFLDGVLTDLRDERADSKLRLTARDQEVVQKIVEGLKRKDARSVVLLGQSGTGKTTLIEGILDHLPRSWRVMMVPREALEQGASYVGEIEKRINAMIQASRLTPIVFVFDEFHSLKGLGTHSQSSVDIIQQLKKYIASGEVMIVATDTPEEYQRAFGADPALRRRFTEVRVEEPRGEELIAKLTRWLESKDIRDIDANLLKRAISVAMDFDPGAHEPARTIRLLEQVTGDRQKAKSKAPLQPKDIDRAAWNLYSVGPEEPATFIDANEKKRVKLKERIVDQDQLVDTMVDLWREVNLGVSPKKHRSMLVVGPTGAGKTFGGQSFAKVVLDDPERFIEIDATKYRNGNFDSLIGTAKYHAESPQGILPEFLSGRGKGRNVIVINEIEKAHPDLIKILMEMLDTGKLQGGDGRTYYVGRSLIIFTSNRGADEVYPVGQGPALRRAELVKRLQSFTDKRVRDLFLKPSSKNLYDTSEVWGAAELQRIDRAVAVAPPSFEGAVSIVQEYARSIDQNLLAQHFYSLRIDRKIAEEIVTQYYVPEEGVRSLLQRTEDLVNRLHQDAVIQFKPQPGEELSAGWDHRTESGDTILKLSQKSTGKDVLVNAALKKASNTSPLLDPSSLTRLQSLEQELAKRVFGQAEALKVVARSVRARALNPQLKTPGNALLLGSTGNGKTETGRALAELLFGNSSRLKIFSMGAVKTEHDWSNIFGSPRGVVGSDTMCPFEKALHDFPEGLVIVLDEIGNMGADPNNPRAGYASPREELLKRLYDMFEEGTWTSPLGKTYDLRKHFILMTSNEGQEFFASLPNDDLRMAEWKRANRREVLQPLLLRHGWPEALLGRIGNNIALMKPLIRAEQVQVARKEVDRVVSQLRSAYEFDAINVADGFYDRLAEAFFSHERGARSLREVAEGAVVDLVGQALIEHSFEREQLKDAKFEIDVVDSFADRFRRSSGDTEERVVDLKLTVTFPNREPQIYSSNVTRDAKPKRLATLKESQITAFHEAGHAVTNQPELTGDNVDFITIRGEGQYGGYVRYKADRPPTAISREGVIARIARILAGQLAQEMAGFEKDSGWQSDLEQARKISEQAISTWGLTDEALSLPVKDGKVILNHPKVQKEIAKLVEEGREECDRLLKERWVEVRILSIALMQRGHLERADLEKLLTGARKVAPIKLEALKARLKANPNGGLPIRWTCLSGLLGLSQARAR